MSDRRILFVGDSHVVGVGDPTGGGWVGRLMAAMDDADEPLTAYNLGIRGASSHEVATRWASEAEARLHPEADCRIVVSFGAHDTDGAREESRRRAPKELGFLLEEAHAMRLPAFVVGPAPIADEERCDRIREISSAFAVVCEERRVPYASVLGPLRDSEIWMEELAEKDGAHPGPAGYQLFAELVIEAGLLDWLLRPVQEPQGLPHRRVPPVERAAEPRMDEGVRFPQRRQL